MMALVLAATATSPPPATPAPCDNMGQFASRIATASCNTYDLTDEATCHKGDKMRANSVTTARHQGYGGSVRVENPQLVRQLSAEHSGDQGLGAESATKGSVPNLRLNELRTDKI